MVWSTLSLKRMRQFFLILAFFLLTTGCPAAGGGACDEDGLCQCSGGRDTCSANWRRGLKCSGCGRAHHVQYLHKTISYNDYKTAHVLVEWDFNANEAPSGTFCVEFEFTISGDGNPMKTSFCLPNVARRFNLTNAVSHLIPSSCLQPNVPLANATFKMGSEEFPLGYVEDCWSVMGNRSLDVCGVQVPSPPVNVSALLSVNSSTNVSTLTVEWSPPLHNNTPILYYRVEFGDSASNRVFTNETSVTLQKKMDVLPTRVSLRAGVRVTGHYSVCLLEEKVLDEGVLYFGSSTSVTVQMFPTDVATPPPIPPSMLPYVITSLVVAVVCTVVLITLVAVVLAFKCHPKPRRDGHNFGITVPIDVPLIQPEAFRAIFIVASTEEDEGMQYKLRYLVHDLADNGIESVYYEYERTSHGPESPGALGISQWVELQFQKCDLVLFAFTKRFLEEWKRESTDQLSPVVWSSRHVLDGLLPHQGNISKFGVVLMGEDCTIPPGLKRFQVFRLFNGDSPTIHSEHLIRYILETPPYAPPRVSMSNHKPLTV